MINDQDKKESYDLAGDGDSMGAVNLSWPEDVHATSLITSVTLGLLTMCLRHVDVTSWSYVGKLSAGIIIFWVLGLSAYRQTHRRGAGRLGVYPAAP